MQSKEQNRAYYHLQPSILLKISNQVLDVAKDNEARMPTSQGGLVQYYDADDGMEFDPKVVIGGVVTVAIMGIALNAGILI